MKESLWTLKKESGVGFQKDRRQHLETGTRLPLNPRK